MLVVRNARCCWWFTAATAAAALAVPISAWAASPGEACRDQAMAAETRAGTPGGLLVAIGRRESGLLDLVTGTILPWP